MTGDVPIQAGEPGEPVVAAAPPAMTENGPIRAALPGPHCPDTAGEWVVFELAPRNGPIPITRTVEVARVLRASVLSHVPDPLPEGVSGHLPDGVPTSVPHIAFLAVPDVGRRHSDGKILGLVVSLPGGLDSLARDATLLGIGLWEQQCHGRSLQLRMGRNGVVEITRAPPVCRGDLRTQTCGRSRRGCGPRRRLWPCRRIRATCAEAAPRSAPRPGHERPRGLQRPASMLAFPSLWTCRCRKCRSLTGAVPLTTFPCSGKAATPTAVLCAGSSTLR